jgi:hypothetical protein
LAQTAGLGYCLLGSGCRGGSVGRDGGGDGGLGDVGGRDGSDSRADMKCLLKGKATQSNNHS